MHMPLYVIVLKSGQKFPCLHSSCLRLPQVKAVSRHLSNLGIWFHWFHANGHPRSSRGVLPSSPWTVVQLVRDALLCNVPATFSKLPGMTWQMISNDKVWYGKTVGKVAAHVPEDLRCILTSVWWTWSESLRKEHLASPSGVNPNNIDTMNQSVGTSPKSPALSGHFKALEAFKSHSYKQQPKYKHMGRCALNEHKIETTHAWHVQSQANAKRCQMWRTQSFLRLKKPPLRWTFESSDFQNLLNKFRSAVCSSFRCSFCSIHQASLLR